jgi:hypothetical protein
MWMHLASVATVEPLPRSSGVESGHMSLGCVCCCRSRSHTVCTPGTAADAAAEPYRTLLMPRDKQRETKGKL